MHKVYCKNCKYYDRREVGKLMDTDIILNRCLKLSKVFRDSIGDLCITDIMDCKDQNAHKNCKYYKRKWWKFWIKKEKQKSKNKKRMRSFSHEARKVLEPFKYSKNLKEIFYSISLIFFRIILWLTIFYKVGILKKTHKELWVRIESTK